MILSSNLVWLDDITKLWAFEVEESKWQNRQYHTLNFIVYLLTCNRKKKTTRTNSPTIVVKAFVQSALPVYSLMSLTSWCRVDQIQGILPCLTNFTFSSLALSFYQKPMQVVSVFLLSFHKQRCGLRGHQAPKSCCLNICCHLDGWWQSVAPHVCHLLPPLLRMPPTTDAPDAESNLLALPHIKSLMGKVLQLKTPKAKELPLTQLWW